MEKNKDDGGRREGPGLVNVIPELENCVGREAGRKEGGKQRGQVDVRARYNC